MINFKKYKRFFVFGCSMTSYYWPTWADIISQEIPKSYNYGQSGGGNLFIASQVTEAHVRYRFNQDDLIMIMWSSISREDRYKDRQWLTPGNIYTQNYFDEKFVKTWADSRGYLIRDLALITMCKNQLVGLGVDFHMLNMAPFVDIQFLNASRYSYNGEEILDFYSDTLSFIKPDILSTEFSGHWPQHPIKHSGGQTADYHPSTRSHANYLQKIFPKLEFSTETENFINKYEQIIKNSREISELFPHWSPQRPTRL